MTYLSRLILNPRDRAVRRDLADCQQLHRTILSAFPTADGDARERFGVLFRLEPPSRDGAQLVLLVQSGEMPEWGKLPAEYLLATNDDLPNPALKSLDALYDALESGRALRFRLRANPTKKIDTKSGPDGQRRNGRRIPVGGTEARLAWLERKASGHGFRLLSVQGQPDVASAIVGPGQRYGGWRVGEDGRVARLSFDAVTFDGSLVVTAVEPFRAALASGIGPGKAYGFGLLTVAPTG